MSSFSIERSRCAADSALRSRTASRRSSFFLTPMSFGLTMSGRRKTKEKLRSLLAQLQPAHLYEVLCDLGNPLLAFMNCEIWPMYKLSVDLMNILSEKRT